MSEELQSTISTQERWLKQYYVLRALVSAAWVVAAFTLGRQSSTAAAVLLIAYPAWDAVANLLDASRSGGLAANPTQKLNAWVSAATTLAVLAALQAGMNAVLAVFGAWAIGSGLLQLATAVRRWKTHGAQWAMVLSGAQSALAGGFFIFQASTPMLPSIDNIAGYAAVGAVYFLVSAVWLAVSHLRRKPALR